MKKLCKCCEVAKLFEEFYCDKSHKDGLTSQCKACKNEKIKLYQTKNSETLKKKSTERYHKNKVLKPVKETNVEYQKIAKEKGDLTFFGVTKCKHGNLGPRYSKSNDCVCVGCKFERFDYRSSRKDKQSEYNKKYHLENRTAILERMRKYNPIYRDKNRDKLIEWSKEWAKNNKELKAARGKAWRLSNLETCKNRAKTYREKNPEIVRAGKLKRNAIKRSATIKWDTELTNLVEVEGSDLCYRRNLITGVEWHVDHMIPLLAENVGGLHVWNNLQLLPATINIGKGNKLELTERFEWMDKSVGIL